MWWAVDSSSSLVDWAISSLPPVNCTQSIFLKKIVHTFKWKKKTGITQWRNAHHRFWLKKWFSIFNGALASTRRHSSFIKLSNENRVLVWHYLYRGILFLFYIILEVQVILYIFYYEYWRVWNLAWLWPSTACPASSVHVATACPASTVHVATASMRP
jgi:hypothetical protein